MCSEKGPSEPPTSTLHAADDVEMASENPLQRLSTLVKAYESKDKAIYARASAAMSALQSGYMSNIERAAFEGLPDEIPAIRATYWKVLLGYLPADSPATWNTVLKNRRATYFAAVETFVWSPHHVRCLKTAIQRGASVQSLQNAMLHSLPRGAPWREAATPSSNETLLKRPTGTVEPRKPPGGEPRRVPMQRSAVTEMDSPLTVPPSASKDNMHVLAEDIETLDQINKDVFRTRAGEGLFNTLLRPAVVPSSGHTDVPISPVNTQYVADIYSPVQHLDIIARILFVYSKLHPSIKYTQGMNELLAPIFYVMFADRLEKQEATVLNDDLQQKEADVFFCFSLLLQLNGHYELFCRTFDRDQCGILGRVRHLASLLRLQDPVLAQHLNRIGLDTQFFALRWILLLFTQEFPLFAVLRFWDAFLAEGDVYRSSEHQLFYFVCLSIMSELRPQLIASEFSTALELLQDLPPLAPESLLSTAVGHRCRVEHMLNQKLL